MQLTQRQINLGLFSFLTILACAQLARGLFVDLPPAEIAGYSLGATVSIALAIAYWRGFDRARYLLVIIFSLIVGFAMRVENMDVLFDPIVLLPPIIALVVAGPLWVIGSAALSLAILLFRGGPDSVYAEVETLITYVILVGTMVFSRLATDSARDLAAAVAEAETARRQVEEQSQRLETRNQEMLKVLDELQQRNADQEQLLAENQQQRAALRELSVPILRVGNGTLVMPLVGALDDERISSAQQRALNSVEQLDAKRLLLDISGVPIVDSQVAQGIVTIVQALRLLGAEAILVGVRPEVAQAIVGLGLDLADIRSYSDVGEALSR